MVGKAAAWDRNTIMNNQCNKPENKREIRHNLRGCCINPSATACLSHLHKRLPSLICRLLSTSLLILNQSKIPCRCTVRSASVNNKLMNKMSCDAACIMSCGTKSSRPGPRNSWHFMCYNSNTCCIHEERGEYIFSITKALDKEKE